ncbi:tRNA (adenosine(37)-N6)-threonylcarbamoyltransferase complex ATPase subunit type 1 TsaE [bacterium]|jgi:tRNA threonylcarbamoyladenosine biosynthesis protein TsaE|nr:tRNA (adenosine(37)-N6)-threonylcarbamoyltransferase complex ATPase subunit type 1 TsaE [bacterium]
MTKDLNENQVQFLTESYLETQDIGMALAEETKNREKAIVFGLSGELGAGKTTFLQGFAKGLGIKEKVISPTFVIMNRFDIKKGEFKNFYHLDCYRIEKASEMDNLGFEEIIADPKNIVCIEWPEKIKKILPEELISIKFKITKENNREITIDYGK